LGLGCLTAHGLIGTRTQAFIVEWDDYSVIFSVNSLLTGMAVIEMKKQHKSSPRISLLFIVGISAVFRY
jgi:hypothetical protein